MKGNRYTDVLRRTVAAWVVLAACATGCEEDAVTPPPPPPANTEFVFVTTTDFQTGSSSVINLDGSYTTSRDVTAIHSDAVARYFNGMIYVVNRMGGDNIQILDPKKGHATVRQFSLGTGADLHDIAFASATRAYVTAYNGTDLLIVDPSQGIQVGQIDLSALADGDGVPEMDRLLLVGDRLFVTIQRIDRTGNWGPVGPSYLAVVDVTTNALIDVDASSAGIQPLVLTGTNPFSDIVIDPTTGGLCVANVGDWGILDGGVEMVDPLALKTDGFVFSEGSAGGDITDVVLVSVDRGYAIITDANFENALVSFNPQSGAKTATVYAPGAFVLQDAELSPAGTLFLTDRTPTQPGIRIFDAVTGTELTADPIDVGLPPFDITFGSP